MRIFVISEFLKSEREYVKVLDTVVNVFINPMKKIVSADHFKSVFSVMKNIMIMNKRLLQSLHERSIAQKQDCNFCVGDILAEFCSESKNYVSYCNNLENALITLESCRKNSEVEDFLEKTEFTGLCGNTDLPTLLSKPLARIAKYLVLVRDILQHTPNTHPDYNSVSSVVAEMEKVGGIVHEARRRSDNLHKILEIQNSISGVEKSNIWTSGRVFLREGNFVRMAKMKTTKLHFFLFNDVIIYVSETQNSLWKKKSENLFTFKGEIRIDHCTVKDLDDSKELKNLFSIDLLNGRKRYILSAASPLEKTMWIKDITTLKNKR